MTAILHRFPHLIWAAREVLRHPGRHALLFAAIACLTLFGGSVLLLSRALDNTWSQLIQQAPDLVVRRLDAGGWAPMPAAAAVAAAQTVPGARTPTPRLWGVVAGPHGPVTVMAPAGGVGPTLVINLPTVRPGQAVVGIQVAKVLTDKRLTLSGQSSLQVSVVGTFPADSAMATGDLVWLAPADARLLLGLAIGQVSDLAIDLYRPEEAQAIQADLAAAFPWPVRITTRQDSAWRHHTGAMRLGSIAMLAALPALLALLYLVADGLLGNGRQSHWGLLKSLGWRSGDIVGLQISKAAMIGLPATCCGLAAAWAVVFTPASATVVVGWLTSSSLPPLHLDRTGALLIVMELLALVMLPYLAAVFLGAARRSSRDAWQLLQEETWR